MFVEKFAQLFKVGGGYALLRQLRGNFPRVVAANRGQPRAHRLFAGNEPQGIRLLCRPERSAGAAEHLFLPLFELPHLILGKVKQNQLHAIAAICAQGCQQAGCGALRGGSGIVQLMREIPS